MRYVYEKFFPAYFRVQESSFGSKYGSFDTRKETSQQFLKFWVFFGKLMKSYESL